MIRLAVWIPVWTVWMAAVPLAMADGETHAHNVSLHVPPALSLEAAQNALDFSFSDNHAGAETNALTIHYAVNSNGMSQPDGAPAVLAQLNQNFEGVEFQAAFGAFTNAGGNTGLSAVSTGFVSVEETPRPLAVKSGSTGDGRVLNGNFPVTYRARAVQKLSAGNYNRELTLTLTDL